MSIFSVQYEIQASKAHNSFKQSHLLSESSGAAYVTRTRDPRITKYGEATLKTYILQCIDVCDG